MYDPSLERAENRIAAAGHGLEFLASEKTNQPWLIVYDDAPGPGVILPWWPKGNAHIVVTGRNPAWDRAVPLDVFEPDAAVKFLCKTARREQPIDHRSCSGATPRVKQIWPVLTTVVPARDIAADG